MRGLLSIQEYNASTAATLHAVLRQYSRICCSAVTDKNKVLLFIPDFTFRVYIYTRVMDDTWMT